MKCSERWLREWINPKQTTEQLCEQLTMAGLEAGIVGRLAEPFTGVVIAQIKSISAHPKVPTLKICQLEIGEAQYVQVVSNAETIGVNHKVALAKIGAHLPAIHVAGEMVEALTLNTVLSQGQLCSAAALGLSEQGEDVLAFDVNAPVGGAVWDHLTLDDRIIEIDFTPNRGDCISIMGLARELSALTGYQLTVPKSYTPKSSITSKLSLDVEVAACPQYLGQIIENINLDIKTPDWIKIRLYCAGLRCIHPIVDITNYVMLELGQPMHAFDLAAIDKAIVVRFAQAGELITLLNGQTLTLTAQTLIIADQTKPLALAGIMGGQASSVTQGCANIFLESAFFEPQCIAATARQYHLHSDSAYRYERGVDPKLAAKALARATQLILEHCGGAAGPIVQHSQVVAQPTAIVLRHSRVEQLLGIKLNAQSSVESLTRLGCQINSAKKTNTWEVLPPSYRFDLTHEVDLIEEIARIQGYAKIPTILPQAQLAVPSTTNTDISNYRIKTALADLGYQEVISFSFVDPAVQAILCPTEKMLSLSNPIAQDLAAMRTNLWPGLLEIVKRNQSRQQSSGLLFEIGRHFRYIETDLIETEVLSGVGFGQQNVKSWHDLPRNIDFYDMKGHIERLWQTVCGQPLSKLSWLAGGHQALHPGQSAKVMYGESTVGHIGAVHPEVLKKLNLIGPVFVYEFNLALFSQKTSWGFKKPSRFPAIRRDLSLTLSKNCSAEAILNFIRHQVGTLLQDTWIFDVYQGANIAPGQKSLGISLILQEASRTLVETEVEVVMQTLISGLTIEFQAKLRD